MKKYSALVTACVFMTSQAMAAPACDMTSGSQAQPMFAPWDDVEGAIVAAVAEAQQQVLMQAYLLTSRKIIQALIDARKRGVDVRILVDAGQQANAGLSRLPELIAADIPVWLEVRYENAHNKIVLIDPRMPGATVITGSFNFTWTAQHRNAENILVVRNNPCIASRFLENWKRHQKDATAYPK